MSTNKGPTVKSPMILTPDNEYAAILDACVLVPMPLCDTLLRLAEEPAAFRPLWSNEILQEVAGAMVKKLGKTTKQAQHRIEQMQEAFPEALVSVPPGLLKAIDCMPDAKDRHVLAAAIKGGAHAIVTQNLKHFPQSCLDEYGILCQSADDFLVHQFHLCAYQILEKLDIQASNLGLERATILENLKLLAPKFAAEVEAQ